jgi:hypothetical protein
VTFARPPGHRGASRALPPRQALDVGTWLDVGGTGDHGDATRPSRIARASAHCPCGGALETRWGRVYYMDTDSIKTDVQMPTGSELGEWKDEVPRYSGFLEGRFYGPKLYRLSVEPSYAEQSRELRLDMLLRDKKVVSRFDEEAKEKALEGRHWSEVKAKGMGRKERTRENLDTLYQGALERLAWLALPENHHPDGRRKPMPKALKEAGTVNEKRLEKMGTLAKLVRRNENGEPVIATSKDGKKHKINAAFERGPLLRNVPKRLHLEGAKRVHVGDGTTVPYHIDMTRKRGVEN